MTNIDIKTLRKATGLTQAEFGSRLGVDHQTIWRWENIGIPSRGAALKLIEREWEAYFGERHHEGNDTSGL